MEELKKFNLFNAADYLEASAVELEETLSVMKILSEALEKEGLQRDEIDTNKAIIFVSRFPMFLNTFRVIERDTYHIIQGLKDASYKALCAHNIQRKTENGGKSRT